MSNQLEDNVRAYVKQELESILDVVKSGELLIKIPQGDDIDLPIEELASLVAKSSNSYGVAARLAGMAKANSKLCKGAFDRKYKQNKIGKNEAERENNAMEHAQLEHQEYILADALSDIAEGIESGARVASESARKLFSSAQPVFQAEKRAGEYGTKSRSNNEEFGAPW